MSLLASMSDERSRGIAMHYVNPSAIQPTEMARRPRRGRGGGRRRRRRRRRRRERRRDRGFR